MNGRLEVSFDNGGLWQEVPNDVSLELFEALRREHWYIGVHEASVRARSLLLEHLDEDQRASYEATGTFVVRAESGETYTVGWQDKAAARPEINRWYCLEPERNVPRADQLLAVKLWLEADEAGFLEKANEFVLDMSREWLPADRQFNLERDLAEEEQHHQQVVAELHQDFQERLADEERRFAERVAEIRERYVSDRRGFAYLDNLNCHCQIEIREPCGPIHFDTLEDARAYAERRNWHVEINIDRHDLPSIFEAGRWIDQEPAYEVDGRPTDEVTVQLLWEALQQREGARPDVEPTDAQRVLAGLPCPFLVGVREGHCS